MMGEYGGRVDSSRSSLISQMPHAAETKTGEEWKDKGKATKACTICGKRDNAIMVGRRHSGIQMQRDGQDAKCPILEPYGLGPTVVINP